MVSNIFSFIQISFSWFLKVHIYQAFLFTSQLDNCYNTYIIHRVFFYNSHRVKSSLLSLELSFKSLLQGRQTSKWRFYTVWQFKTKGVKARHLNSRNQNEGMKGTLQVWTGFYNVYNNFISTMYNCKSPFTTMVNDDHLKKRLRDRDHLNKYLQV